MAKFWSEDEGPPHVVGRLLQDDELKPRGIDIYALYRKETVFIVLEENTKERTLKPLRRDTQLIAYYLAKQYIERTRATRGLNENELLSVPVTKGKDYHFQFYADMYDHMFYQFSPTKENPNPMILPIVVVSANAVNSSSIAVKSLPLAEKIVMGGARSRKRKSRKR